MQAASESGAAAYAVPGPKLKPRALRVVFVVPSICCRDVTRVERSGVRRGKDAFQPLDFSDRPFGIHFVLNIQHEHGSGQTETVSMRRPGKQPRRDLCRRSRVSSVQAGMVGAAGIEPATLGLEIRCSIRLSYAPVSINVPCERAEFPFFNDSKSAARRTRRPRPGFSDAAANGDDY